MKRLSPHARNQHNDRIIKGRLLGMLVALIALTTVFRLAGTG